jgi:hypothetical protein
MPPLPLSPQQLDRLGLEIARVFVLDDFGVVLGRYPGRGEPATFLPADPAGRPMLFVTSACLKEVDREGTLLPFLSRVVEHKWEKAAFRSAIFGQVRVLVRPDADSAPHIAAIIAALAALTPILATDPAAGQCGGRATCKFVRDHRPEIDAIVQALDQFEALKILHDSLHVLEVKGSDWLDQVDGDAASDLPLPILQAIVEAVRNAGTIVKQRVPPAAAASCQRCIDTATDAATRLAANNPDQQDFAVAQLRALVANEPAGLDTCMFGLSRDLPLKQLRGLMESASDLAEPIGGQMAAAAEALDRLSETMRAQILEHALWQATESHIRAVSQLLAHPGPNFLRDLSAEWSAVRQNLQTLVDRSATDSSPIEAAFNGAIVLYERALPTPGLPTPPGPTAEARLAEMVAAFNDFRAKARLHFLAVDQALKSVFSSLLPLRASLDGVRRRVPNFCTCPP